MYFNGHSLFTFFVVAFFPSIQGGVRTLPTSVRFIDGCASVVFLFNYFAKNNVLVKRCHRLTFGYEMFELALSEHGVNSERMGTV